MNKKTNWISDILSITFGMLIILIIFGDALGDAIPLTNVGNLDTIFGNSFWPVMDVIYPLASVVIFLLYGRSKGKIEIKLSNIILLLIFLAFLAMMQFDDILVVFGHRMTFPDLYWTIARWLYLVISISTFLAFGRTCQEHRVTAR